MEYLLETMTRESHNEKQCDNSMINCYSETSSSIPNTSNYCSSQAFLLTAITDHHEQELPSNEDYQQLTKTTDADQQNQSNSGVRYKII